MRSPAGLEALEVARGVGEDGLRELLGLVVVRRPAADVAEDLAIVAAKRLL